MMRWIRSVIAWIKNLFAKNMRRKINLYIGDQLVDLDDQSFILFNYQMDDLSNPTIVKNSFSQPITLKGTPRNNKVFGDYFRADRRIAHSGGETGVDFAASQKTPFTIYNEMGEILESGYVKLDSISRNRGDVQYNISLYGGLGSFFYALSYDENGNKRTLADLDYLGTGNADSELTFTINVTSVSAAWARLMEFPETIAGIWDVINFAPAYNGIPEGNFSPDKAIVDPASVGLRDTITDNDVAYTTRSGYALVNLAQAQDEWAVKDLRSYLQRPVLSMRALWSAISNPDNNGGYEVDSSVVFNDLKIGRYAKLWMTLPLISSIGSFKQESGDLSLTMSSVPALGNEVGRFDVVGSVPSGTKISANLHCKIRFNMPSGADAYTELTRTAGYINGRVTDSKISAIFIQAVAYGSDDAIVGGSAVKVAGNGRTAASIAQACGYNPAWISDYEKVNIETFEKVSSGVYEIPMEMGFSVEAQDVAYYKILVSVYPGTQHVAASDSGRDVTIEYTGDGSISTPVLYHDYNTGFTPFTTFIVHGAATDTITYASSDTLRSGATITKKMLLSSSHTPAEYMISFCKILGLYFTYDHATRKVTIHRRNDLYQDETIDLSKRVDLSKGVTIDPMAYDAKWYDFILESDGGAFYDEYLNVEGVPYGMHRVDTGYDFNAEAVSLMENVVFKNACTILARSRYFNYIFKGQSFQPSPFLDKGNTYTLWSASGETLETDIACPPFNASVTYYNDTNRGYDSPYGWKLELCTKDNKPIDGADILVFNDGFVDYDYFKLTDDLPVMNALNDGVPCWLLGAGAGTGDDALKIPTFNRYRMGAFAENIRDSLDFGIPRQLDIPNVTYKQGITIYERGWMNYMRDRYDENTKVMKCRVDFSGMQVNQGLLRKFYWYENSLWVLNKITNYSLTTYDPVECEFVQVQDKDNYLNGQIYG